MASTSGAGSSAGAAHASLRDASPPPPPPWGTAPVALFDEMGPDLSFADPALEADFRTQHNRAQRHLDVRAAAAARPLAATCAHPPDCCRRAFTQLALALGIRLVAWSSTAL